MGLKSKAAAGALALALGSVVAWEGYKEVVYLDPVGIPTVCYGYVVDRSVKVGEKFSAEACTQLLMRELKEANAGVKASVKVPLSEKQEAAFTSFVYNAGIGNFRKSTMLKLINQGRVIEACHELPKWVYAKGKKLKGLVNRRQAEMELCLGNA